MKFQWNDSPGVHMCTPKAAVNTG